MGAIHQVLGAFACESSDRRPDEQHRRVTFQGFCDKILGSIDVDLCAQNLKYHVLKTKKNRRLDKLLAIWATKYDRRQQML